MYSRLSQDKSDFVWEFSDIRPEHSERITIIYLCSPALPSMAPKSHQHSTTADTLSGPELELLQVAARLDLAMRYWEGNGNPNETVVDYDSMLQGIDHELVRIPSSSRPEITYLSWKSIVNQIVMDASTPPRTHPIIDLIGEEFRRADSMKPKQQPDFNAFGTTRVSKACKATRAAHPRWNTKLTMVSLVMIMDNYESEHWWVARAGDEKVKEDVDPEMDAEADADAEEDVQPEQEYNNDEGDFQPGMSYIHEYMSSANSSP